ncbi:MAG: hypothetical protein ACR2PY_04600, partial [Salinispira sp.]
MKRTRQSFAKCKIFSEKNKRNKRKTPEIGDAEQKPLQKCAKKQKVFDIYVFFDDTIIQWSLKKRYFRDAV